MRTLYMHDCGQTYSLPPRAAGRRLRCWKCGKSFPAPQGLDRSVPEASSEPAAAVAQAALVPDPPPPPTPPSALVSLAGLALLAAAGLALYQAAAGVQRIPFLSGTLCLFSAGAWVRARARRAAAESRRVASDDARADATNAAAALEAGRTLAAGWLATMFGMKAVLSLSIFATGTFLPLIGAILIGVPAALTGGWTGGRRPSARSVFEPLSPITVDAVVGWVEPGAIGRFAVGVAKLIAVVVVLFLLLILLGNIHPELFGRMGC